MKILLVAPVKDNSSGLAQFPPIGLGYVATALRRAGYREVGILDCILEGLSIDSFAARVELLRPDVVGVNSWSLSVREVAKTLAAVKSVDPAITTVVGGPHPSAIGPDVLDEFGDADYAFRGEAEKGAPMLIDYLCGRPCPDREMIPGLMWREGGVKRANPRGFEMDLDRLGTPSWDLIRPERYALPGSLIQKDTACIITTRGCPFPCTFCSAYLTTGRKLRMRAISNVMEEIRLLYHCYGIRRFVVFDENITLNHGHIRSFCEHVISSGLDVTFELPNGIRLDTLNMEILSLMRRAGFSERVAVGIESGSDRVLKFMKKGLTREEIRAKVDLLNTAGFRPIGYFILGYPTETREELKETIDFALDLKLYRAGFMPFHPLPGTESYEFLVARGELPEDFDFSALSTDNVPYSPEGITPEELERARKLAILRFNLRPRVMWDYMRDYNSFRFAIKKLRSIFMRKHPAGRASRKALSGERRVRNVA